MIHSLSELAEAHCQQFPLDDLLRLAEGRLSAKHGMHLVSLDWYIRKFVGQDKFLTAGEFEADSAVEEEDEDEEEGDREPQY